MLGLDVEVTSYYASLILIIGFRPRFRDRINPFLIARNWLFNIHT